MEQKLCQIYIPNTGNQLPQPQFYHVGLNGRYKAKVVGITWTDDTQTGDHRFIRVQSDAFRIGLGTFKNTICFGNKGDHAQGHPGGDYPFGLEVMGGGIKLELTSSTAYTGVGNDSFFFCILTLQVEPIA